MNPIFLLPCCSKRSLSQCAISFSKEDAASLCSTVSMA